MKAAAGSRKPAAKTPGRQKPASPAAVSDTAPAAVPIAIISMEGMFPQSPDLDTFEAHLAAGDDCIEEIPGDRWDWRSVHGDPKKRVPSRM
ncbi:beta-ketoacyl synthase N-terminal-like domain-containing protein [Roseibium salinum]|nr:beta-ketoacyl synthase N-terminal-like domain-containing protein [Roseibium salinum]